jgi:addiction module RelE/StbE family toxin
VKVKWTPGAITDLREIFDYLYHRNADAARRIARLIGLAADRLPRAPFVGRIGRVAGTRELVIQGTPYLIGYRVVADSVEILCVRHGARQWPDTL